MYITDHPIIEKKTAEETVHITVDGRLLEVSAGSMIAAALLANGILVNRYTLKNREARGAFCGIGQCTDCVMIVNGQRNVRTCITPVSEGMVVITQDKD